jgi:hypothetical protein
MGTHNRVLWVDRHGSIHEIATFGNVVPTGLETVFWPRLRQPNGPDPPRPRGRQSRRPTAYVVSVTGDVYRVDGL